MTNTYGKYGVICKKCSTLVAGNLNTCKCGTIKIRKLKDETTEGLVIYTDDPSAIESLTEGYYDSSGNLVKVFELGSLIYGKSIFLELEHMIGDYKMYHKHFSCEDVVNIIKRYIFDYHTQQEIANDYGVSKKEIYNIVYRVIKKGCKLPDEIAGEKYYPILRKRALTRTRGKFRAKNNKTDSKQEV